MQTEGKTMSALKEMMTQEDAMNMSNEQAVQILIPMRNMMRDQNGCPISDAVFALDKAIEALSADRPSGEWIITESHKKGQIIYHDYKCSICGHHRDRRMNYCEVCGARMKGVYND